MRWTNLWWWPAIFATMLAMSVIIMVIDVINMSVKVADAQAELVTVKKQLQQCREPK